MKILSRFLCLTFTLFTLHAWAANVAYKCTTSSGEISFLDKKPTEGCATIEVVNIYDGTPVTDVTETEDTDTQAEQDKKEIAERSKKAKEDCQKRTSELDSLRTRSQVVITDPITKEKTVLSPEEHQAKIRQYEEYIKTFCSGATTGTSTTTPAL